MDNRCDGSSHQQRVLWGYLPSEERAGYGKWIWECPRCGDQKLSASPNEFIPAD